MTLPERPAMERLPMMGVYKNKEKKEIYIIISMVNRMNIQEIPGP